MAYRSLLGTLRRIGFGRRGGGHGVLIFKRDRIGDFVLASGIINLLNAELGFSHVSLMVSQVVQPLAERLFPDCRIIPVPEGGEHLREGMVSAWQHVRRANAGRRYRLLINLRYHPTLFEDLLLNSIRAEESFGMGPTELCRSHCLSRLRTFQAGQNCNYPNARSDFTGCLELEAHRRIGERVLKRPVQLTEVIPRFPSLPAVEEDYLLVCPFSSAPIKDYPIMLLTDALLQSKLPASRRVVVCGQASRSSSLDQVARALRKVLPNRVDVLQPGSVLEFIDSISRASCIVSMDSAAAHIATAFDKRGVFLLGGGHFGYFAPWYRSSRQQWLHLKLACFGCDWRCTQASVRCMREIPADTVASALRNVWHAS